MRLRRPRGRSAGAVQGGAVPYRSGGALAPDLIGGAIPGAFTEFSTGLPLHKEGLGKIIAIAADNHPDAPDIPMMIEGTANVTAESFIGVLAPAAAPVEVLVTLERAHARRREGCWPRQGLGWIGNVAFMRPARWSRRCGPSRARRLAYRPWRRCARAPGCAPAGRSLRRLRTASHCRANGAPRRG
jgi:hypothetical protein